MFAEKKKIISIVLTVLMVISLAPALMTFDNVYAKGTSSKVINYRGPENIYKGSSAIIGGVVKTTSKMNKIIVGISDHKGKMIDNMYVKVNPKGKIYNVAEADYSIKFGKLKPGTYYYKIKARYGGKYHTIVSKKFTVSYITGSKITKPSKIKKGKGFFIKGYVNSAIPLKYVKVGVANSSGSFKKNYYVKDYLKSKSYNVQDADWKIKFGKLSKGTYRYKIYAKDASGKSISVVNKKFKVVSKTSTSSSGSSRKKTSSKKPSRSFARSSSVSRYGRTLSYKGYVINNIGGQKVSGPCGLYAMAYCRTVIDGYFRHPSYSWLKRVYGHGSNCAYWWEAGGSSQYYSTSKSCYRAALRQLASGRPCIINVYNGYTGNQHYIALIGYKAGTTYDNVSLSKFIALDPAYGMRINVSNMKYYNNSSPQCIAF